MASAKQIAWRKKFAKLYGKKKKGSKSTKTKKSTVSTEFGVSTKSQRFSISSSERIYEILEYLSKESERMEESEQYRNFTKEILPREIAHIRDILTR